MEYTEKYIHPFTDFGFKKLFRFESGLYSVVPLKDLNNEIYYEKLTYIYLQLPKFTKTEYELETNFEKWLFVIKKILKISN
jgi:hypothetical protein